ncbi:MAG: hypothetical protein ACRD40_10000, partial [Candidatus Acidiferrales bacterium]
EQKQLAVNAWGSPGRILGDHLEDELSYLLWQPLSADLVPPSGDQSPVQAEAGSVPANHRFRGDDDERVLLFGPDSSCRQPEQLVQTVQSGHWMPTLENRELLSESRIFQQQATTRTKQTSDRHQPEPNKWRSCRDNSRYRVKFRRRLNFLILKTSSILASHRKAVIP